MKQLLPLLELSSTLTTTDSKPLLDNIFAHKTQTSSKKFTEGKL